MDTVIDREMDKRSMGYVYNELLFQLLKRRKSVTSYMKNLRDILLNKMNQSQKDKYCTIPLMGVYLKLPNSWK